MKWVVLASFFVCFATLSRGSAPTFFPVSESTEPSSNVRERKKDRRTECLAGSEWESKCHKCRCSEEGHAECTRMDVCEKGDYENPIRCKPKSTFKIECNTCSCLDDGQVLCTLIGCLSSVPDLPVISETKTPDGKGRACLAGSRWKSKCNECFCTEDGSPTCTEMGCGGREDEPELTCAPGTTWMNECNRCWCQGGNAACTRIGCNTQIITDFNPNRFNSEEPLPKINISLNRRIRATAQEPPKQCQPGVEFRMDCNKCLCDNEGQNYSCTRIDCAALNNNGNGGARRKREATAQVQTQCVPESVFNQGCNVCRCEADGNHATCSVKRCKQDKPDEDEDNEPDSDLSFRCNPGEQFKRGCNDCTCSADGKSVFCTIRLCDQDITPTM